MSEVDVTQQGGWFSRDDMHVDEDSADKISPSGNEKMPDAVELRKRKSPG
jgi:hypothetical protein